MANERKISQDDFDDWRENAITRAVLAHVARQAEGVLEEWVSLLFQRPTAETMANLPGDFLSMQAQHQMLTELAEIDLSDIQEEEDDGDASDSGSDEA